MKQLLAIMSLITLFSCSKQEDVLLNKPIKKDVTAPTLSIEQPDAPMQLNFTCTAKIIATDDMAIKAVYYYENGFLSRSFISGGTPGRSATYWDLQFPFMMYTDIIDIKVVCIDASGNITEQTKSIKAVF